MYKWGYPAKAYSEDSIVLYNHTHLKTATAALHTVSPKDPTKARHNTSILHTHLETAPPATAALHAVPPYDNTLASFQISSLLQTHSLADTLPQPLLFCELQGPRSSITQHSLDLIRICHRVFSRSTNLAWKLVMATAPMFAANGACPPANTVIR